MHIGIVPALSGLSGGVYQYSLTMLQALSEWKGDPCTDEFVVFADDMHHPVLVVLRGHGWAVQPLQSSSLKRVAKSGLRWAVGEARVLRTSRWLRSRLKSAVSLPDPDSVRSRPDMTRRFSGLGVELMLYPTPTTLSFETEIPYVMAVHDLQHRLQPEFPEVSVGGEWEWREYLFRNGARYATLLLADSEVGKEDILTFYGSYGVTADRVKVLPFLPASYLGGDSSESGRQRVRTTYHLPEHYLFYPAQFWPHKNHARIIQALELLRMERRLKVPIVLAGSHAGEIQARTFREVMLLSHRLGIEDQVHYLDYVPEEDMSALYAGAMALVMPTFFGPTNIPVLEAWASGCPVITSDIRGIRQQSGDAALLVDPRSVEAIADGVYRTWTDETLRHALADRGRKRLATYTSDHYRCRLSEILEEAKARARSEKSSRGMHKDSFSARA